MRQDLVARVNPEAAPDLGTLEEQWDAVAGAARGGAPAAPAAPPPQQQQPQQESGGEGGEIDDDELLALQAEDQWVRLAWQGYLHLRAVKRPQAKWRG